MFEILKIKENIQPKELEKFGFKPETKNKKIIGYQNKYMNFYTENQKHCKARELNVHMGGTLNDGAMLSCVYDLVKADIVEKEVCKYD